jgi:hypothetical protein
MPVAEQPGRCTKPAGIALPIRPETGQQQLYLPELQVSHALGTQGATQDLATRLKDSIRVLPAVAVKNRQSSLLLLEPASAHKNRHNLREITPQLNYSVNTLPVKALFPNVR